MSFGFQPFSFLPHGTWSFRHLHLDAVIHFSLSRSFAADSVCRAVFAPFGLALSSVVIALPVVALPFDPLPSAFQRWINAAAPGRRPPVVSVQDLGRCVDHTQPSSPYRSPAFTCLQGVVVLRQDPSRRCALDRISYFPRQERLGLWPSRSCSAAGWIPRSVSWSGRVPLAPAPSP